MKQLVSSNFCLICDSLMLCNVHLFGKKIIFHEIFQVGACPNLNDFSLYERFLYSCVQSMKHSVSPTFFLYLRLPYALYGTIFWKRMTFHEIFQVGPCPNLKDSSLYERFSILMYKACSFRYLQHFSSICNSLMPCTVHYFGKRLFFDEIFQIGPCPNLKGSSLYGRFSIHMYKA